MPKIRLQHSMNINDENHSAGDEVEVAADVAKYLCQFNRAELVRAPKTERAVKRTPETA